MSLSGGRSISPWPSGRCSSSCAETTRSKLRPAAASTSPARACTFMTLDVRRRDQPSAHGESRAPYCAALTRCAPARPPPPLHRRRPPRGTASRPRTPRGRTPQAAPSESLRPETAVSLLRNDIAVTLGRMQPRCQQSRGDLQLGPLGVMRRRAERSSDATPLTATHAPRGSCRTCVTTPCPARMTVAAISFTTCRNKLWRGVVVVTLQWCVWSRLRRQALTAGRLMDVRAGGLVRRKSFALPCSSCGEPCSQVTRVLRKAVCRRLRPAADTTCPNRSLPSSAPPSSEGGQP